MKLSLILALVGIVAASPHGAWVPVDNKNHTCTDEANCAQKCQDGKYHLGTDKYFNITSLRCDGRHSDYRYMYATCRRLMSGQGMHPERQTKSCKLVDGLLCHPSVVSGEIKRSSAMRCIIEPCRWEEFDKDCRSESYDVIASKGFSEVPLDCNPNYLP